MVSAGVISVFRGLTSLQGGAGWIPCCKDSFSGWQLKGWCLFAKGWAMKSHLQKLGGEPAQYQGTGMTLKFITNKVK